MKKFLALICIVVIISIIIVRNNSDKIFTTDGTNPSESEKNKVAKHFLIAVGDIGDCNSEYDEKVAQLVGQLPGTIALLGDIGYPDGSWDDFMNCFDPAWGKLKSRIRPAVGNHEYHTENASAYFKYFGKRAGEEGKGFYSYDIGKWHIIALNSQLCVEDPDCEHSEQITWLKEDLDKHRNFCTLAYRHHPRFSSGPSSNDQAVLPFWEVLYNAGSDISLAGHDHMYERFPPLNPIGQIDNEYGIRSFVVGTGGTMLHNLGRPARNSEIKENNSYGVLVLTLYDKSYSWEFKPINGQTFTDKGEGVCHGEPPEDKKVSL